MGYDLSNLNNYEFEELAKDVMEKKLDIKLNRFSSGRDQGIDLCDSGYPYKVIIQAKRYVKSLPSQLMRDLKSEPAKVAKHNPEKYYIFTSLELTRDKKEEIVNLFSKYMTDISYIIDKIVIDDFLNDQANRNIVERHYKLWLASSNVLSLIRNQSTFIDCDILLMDINDEVKKFVQTQDYELAFKKLEKEKLIVLTGAPGVGKTTLSKMLLFKYASNNFKIRYSTNGNISEIKNVLSKSPDEPEIILLDDFLGQHYIKIDDKSPTEINSLISFIKRNKNKRLILNSRITILNEAIQRNFDFELLMEKSKEQRYLIDLDIMSDLEKARILYNHLYFSKLPYEFWESVKLDNNYFDIILHDNYNPRIIEFVTTKSSYDSIGEITYFEFIKNHLDNPEKVWHDEFRNRLSEVDRLLITTLYSLTDDMIENEILEKAFNKRFKGDANLNQYEETLKRLNRSLLKVVESKGIRKIAVLNPSINDYLLRELILNIKLQEQLVDEARYYEQITRAIKHTESNKHFVKQFTTGKFNDLEALEKNPNYYFLRHIVKNNIFQDSFREKVKVAIKCFHHNIKPREKNCEYSEVLLSLMSNNFFYFYELSTVVFNEFDIDNLLKPMDIDDIKVLYNLMIKKYDMRMLEFVFELILVDKVSEDIIDEAQCELYDCMTVINDHYYTEGLSIDLDSFATEVEEEIENIIIAKISDFIKEDEIDQFIDEHQFDVRAMVDSFDIMNAVVEYLNDSNYNKSDFERKYENHENHESEIIALFESYHPNS